MSEMRELTTAVNEDAILEIKSKSQETNADWKIIMIRTSNPVKLPIHYPSEQIP